MFTERCQCQRLFTVILRESSSLSLLTPTCVTPGELHRLRRQQTEERPQSIAAFARQVSTEFADEQLAEAPEPMFRYSHKQRSPLCRHHRTVTQLPQFRLSRLSPTLVYGLRDDRPQCLRRKRTILSVGGVLCDGRIWRTPGILHRFARQDFRRLLISAGYTSFHARGSRCRYFAWMRIHDRSAENPCRYCYCVSIHHQNIALYACALCLSLTRASNAEVARRIPFSTVVCVVGEQSDQAATGAIPEPIRIG